MAKINDTSAYPTVTPASNDLLIGTDKSNTTNDPNGETATFSVSGLLGTQHDHTLSDITDLNALSQGTWDTGTSTTEAPISPAKFVASLREHERLQDGIAKGYMTLKDDTGATVSPTAMTNRYYRMDGWVEIPVGGAMFLEFPDVESTPLLYLYMGDYQLHTRDALIRSNVSSFSEVGRVYIKTGGTTSSDWDIAWSRTSWGATETIYGFRWYPNAVSYSDVLTAVTADTSVAEYGYWVTGKIATGTYFFGVYNKFTVGTIWWQPGLFQAFYKA